MAISLFLLFLGIEVDKFASRIEEEKRRISGRYLAAMLFRSTILLIPYGAYHVCFEKYCAFGGL